ncbi:MAG: DUF4352 domain-containing protein [Chloroflexi bacterium]|nr:DUF4352 domain-containing protein [Chloroflexota bacterium]
MQRIGGIWRSGKGGKLGVGCGGLLIVFVLCGLVAQLSGGSPASQATATAKAEQVAVVPGQPTNTARPPADTATPKPTEAPKATDTPKPPSATPTPKPPPATPTPLAKVGDKLIAPNWEITVGKPEKMKTLVWSEYGNKTDAKGEWLIIPLTLKNIGKQNFGINNFDFV